MARINIKCHPAPGFDGVWAAKRKWPATGITVDTIDGDVDIEPTTESPVLKVGAATLKELEETGRFSFGIGGTLEEIVAMRARIDELEAENAALKAKGVDLEAQVSSAVGEAEDSASHNKGKRGKAP